MEQPTIGKITPSNLAGASAGGPLWNFMTNSLPNEPVTESTESCDQC